MTAYPDMHSDEASPQTTASSPPVSSSTSIADQPVATISRVAFNYLLIAVVFLLVGLVVGFFGYERVSGSQPQVDEAMIQRAVATAVAGLPVQGAAEAADARMNVEVADNPYKGPDDAVITLIEFGDFNCGYCQRFQEETLTPLLEQFDGKIKFVFRDYPLLGQASLAGALASECADDQGKYWEFHDMLYAAPDQLNRDAFMTYATHLEMDVDQFASCFDNQDHRSEIIQDYVAGQNAGVSGTPTFFINGKILVGAQPLETFVWQIESELSQIEDADAAAETTTS